MKVYIASKYISHKEINQRIFSILQNNQIDAFLPESINIDAVDKSEMLAVSEICYREIECSDVFLAVCPFGRSVSAEFGYAIALQKKLHIKKTFIALKMDFDNEAMLFPYLDYVVTSVDDLVKLLIDIESKEE